jgi:trimethylamine--corrinoid protein Co-methyltransferase
MRSTALLTQVANRDAREAWTEKGAPDAHTRAMQLAREILARDNPAVWSPQVDERIRAEFEGLVE